MGLWFSKASENFKTEGTRCLHHKVLARPCFFIPEGAQKGPPEKGRWKGTSCMSHWEPHRMRQASNRDCMICLLLALALGAAANAAGAQTTLGSAPQSSKGAIRGVVTVLGQQAEPSPLEGIRVEATDVFHDSQPLSSLTDSAGRYEFPQLSRGTYTVRVNQQGFKPFAETVSLNANETSGVGIT